MLKKFKLGFTAIIAVLAISATLASYAGAFNGTKLDIPVAGKCYQQLNGSEPLVCGPITEFCATQTVNVLSVPGTCDPNTIACCYVVSSDPCPNGLLVKEIRCGDFIAD